MKTHKITFSQALEGYTLYFNSRHLSPYTYKDYCNTFRKFANFLGNDPPIEDITLKQVEAFLAAQEVSNKTILNYHTGLSALWTWALEDGLVKVQILHKVKRPKPEKREIKPYSEVDIRAMLGALDKSKSYTRRGKKESDHSLSTAIRNRAIILLLLDTGIRSSELCSLRIHQADLTNRHILVMGKGSKERMLPFCSRTGRALWRYLATRQDDRANDYYSLQTMKRLLLAITYVKPCGESVSALVFQPQVSTVSAIPSPSTSCVMAAIPIRSNGFSVIQQWKWSCVTSQSPRQTWTKTTNSPPRLTIGDCKTLNCEY